MEWRFSTDGKTGIYLSSDGWCGGVNQKWHYWVAYHVVGKHTIHWTRNSAKRAVEKAHETRKGEG